MDLSESNNLSPRKLATIRRIDAILPIEGADLIQLAKIDGWQVVVGKDQGYEIGSLVVFCEIDSWVPTELAPFLSKGKEPREYNGIKGERLRSIKLRGALSQGLVLPIKIITGTGDDGTPRWLLTIGEEIRIDTDNFTEGKDMTDLLGITKWEKPIPAQLRGQMRGNFPSFLRKTDQERVQNLPEIFTDGSLAHFYEATVKLDGSSMSVWFNGEDWGVCSRNIDLKLDQEGNTFVDTAKRVFHDGLREVIPQLGNLCFQGELVGEGIQGNRENLTGHHFYLFDIWVIDEQRYMDPFERMVMCKRLNITPVPLIGILPLGSFGESVDDLLAMADSQPSLNHEIAEGIVFKRCDGQFSFKAISNKFLLAGGD